MPNLEPLVFYDIASGPPVRTYAPNPWKARLALNIKRVPYVTSWTELPDISKVRIAAGVPASRKFADGTDYHTLPMLRDPNTQTDTGDSFDIACYLDASYRDLGEVLFPDDATDALHAGLSYRSPHADIAIFAPLSENKTEIHKDYASFNTQVDATFSAYVVMFSHGLPFNPDTADKMAALFKNGPFMDGERVTYADVIVGGWLRMLSVTMPTEEWEDLKTWHGGLFGTLYKAMELYAEIK
ncbi:hypothetical protein BKA62DRAFT_300058 [Auriculariales sp. MPI-PUGE-AT-0066]|nr:hypothetical protein BKA62DRAFT_300058 [Auriculariales sp. MPI-PUGE-AT-0066]